MTTNSSLCLRSCSSRWVCSCKLSCFKRLNDSLAVDSCSIVRQKCCTWIALIILEVFFYIKVREAEWTGEHCLYLKALPHSAPTGRIPALQHHLVSFQISITCRTLVIAFSHDSPKSTWSSLSVLGMSPALSFRKYPPCASWTYSWRSCTGHISPVMSARCAWTAQQWCRVHCLAPRAEPGWPINHGHSGKKYCLRNL